MHPSFSLASSVAEKPWGVPEYAGVYAPCHRGNVYMSPGGYIYVCMHVLHVGHANTDVCLYVSLCVCAHVCIQVYMHMDACMYMHVCALTRDFLLDRSSGGVEVLGRGSTLHFSVTLYQPSSTGRCRGTRRPR